MSFHVAFYFAASAVILTHSKIASVNGQCTTEGCARDDLSMNIVTEIQQQIGQQNKQIQNMHDVMIASFQQLTSQHDAVMRSLQAVDRRLEEHDAYIKQSQSFHEFINESLLEMKGQQTVDRRSNEHDMCIKQVPIIYELLNKSLQQMKNQLEAVDANLQAVDRNLGNYQLDIKNQTEKSWKLVNDVCDPVYSVKDCSDIKAQFYFANGVYEVCVGHQPNRVCANAYCDMKTTSGASLVFQRRRDGSVNFNRTWAEYREGFGNPDGEFWLGNEMLYLLTSKRNYKLRVDLEDFNGIKRYAEYSTFSINSSTSKYRLTVGGYTGNAGDGMNYTINNFNGRQFSTIDVDNDHYSEGNCAQRYGGAWWHGGCSTSTLNGKYYHRTDTVISATGIHWYEWKKTWTYSLKATEMKLVPVA